MIIFFFSELPWSWWFITTEKWAIPSRVSDWHPCGATAGPAGIFWSDTCVACCGLQTLNTVDPRKLLISLGNLHWRRRPSKGCYPPQEDLATQKSDSVKHRELVRLSGGGLEPQQWCVVTDPDWCCSEMCIFDLTQTSVSLQNSKDELEESPLDLLITLLNMVTLNNFQVSAFYCEFVYSNPVIEARWLNPASWGTDYEHKVIYPHWLPRVNGTEFCYCVHMEIHSEKASGLSTSVYGPPSKHLLELLQFYS